MDARWMIPRAKSGPRMYPVAIEMAYRLVTKALCSGSARASRMVSQLTQIPTEHAPSMKRIAATVGYEPASGNSPTHTA